MKKLLPILTAFLIGIASLLFVPPAKAALIFSDTFSGGYNSSLWTLVPAQPAPIPSDFGIRAAESNKYSSLVRSTSLPRDLIVKVDMKINTSPAADMGIFINDTLSGKWKNIFLFGVGNGGFPNNAMIRDSSIWGNPSLYARGPWDYSQGIHSIEVHISGNGNTPITIIEDGNTILTWTSSLDFDINQLSVSFYGINSEFANFQLCDSEGCPEEPTPTPSPSPTPTPTATPSPSPTPTPTPNPTPKKVVVIPGYFGSFNGEELVSCNLDFHSGEWTNWSKADPFYTPLMQSLINANFTVLPFYYDWRRTAATNAESLAAYIHTNIPNSSEKFDLVAHSFGGLVARAYLEQFGANRIDHLLTAGTPHRGTPLAYPAWSAGDIWFGGQLGYIFKALVRWCSFSHGKTDREMIRSIAPSVENLLPIDNYLIHEGETEIPVALMNAKNTWLLNRPFPAHDNVIFGTLSGTGRKTIATLPLTNKTPKNIPADYWIDGYTKKSDSVKVTLGDDTVHNISSMLPDETATNPTIPDAHVDLMSSTNGQRTILDFLGATDATTSAYMPIEVTSAFAVIASPGSFWVVDPDGRISRDTDHFYIAENPKNGTFRLLFLPSSGNSRILIAKFLPNGKTIWKERVRSSRVPYIESISFNSAETD